MYIGIDPADCYTEDEAQDPHYEPGDEMDCG